MNKLRSLLREKAMTFWSTVSQPLFFKQSKLTDFSFLLQSSDIFRHACKTPLSVLLCNLEQELETQESIAASATSAALSPSTTKSSFIAAKTLSRIIRMIETSQDSSGEVFDIGDSIKQVITMLVSQYPGAKIQFDTKPALITGNKILFQESLLCLVKNAIEAQKECGQPRPLVILWQRIINDSMVRVDIIDFGPGMDTFKSRLVKQKGYTDKKGGSGIGIPFAIEAIEKKFGGSFQVSTYKGMGTRIMLSIPI